LIRTIKLDLSFVEEVLTFAVGGDGLQTIENAQQYCLSIEQPSLSLAGVLTGMLKNEDCQKDLKIRMRYTVKVFLVLRLVAKSLRYIHSIGIVHGNVHPETCCKFGNEWKLASTIGMQRSGDFLNPTRFSHAAPPEAIESVHRLAGKSALIRRDVVADPSMDVWGFGKLAFDVLVGESLIALKGRAIEDDGVALMTVLNWDDFNLEDVRQRLGRVGIFESGTDLILHCLSTDPRDRPSMDDILDHPVWKDVGRFGR
jgi:serine/threonine protein kinase